MKTIEDLTGLWETDAAFALAVGIDRKTIALFKHRKSIPSHAWTRVRRSSSASPLRACSAFKTPCGLSAPHEDLPCLKSPTGAASGNSRR
jgi:hypothetical protein